MYYSVLRRQLAVTGAKRWTPGCRGFVLQYRVTVGTSKQVTNDIEFRWDGPLSRRSASSEREDAHQQPIFKGTLAIRLFDDASMQAQWVQNIQRGICQNELEWDYYMVHDNGTHMSAPPALLGDEIPNL